MDIARELCLATFYGTDSDPSDMLDAFELLREDGAFVRPPCVCFADYFRELTREEYERENPDVEFVEMSVDECLDYLLKTFAPYQTQEDRVRDVCARLLSGYEDIGINSRVYEDTNSELTRVAWPTPRFAKRKQAPHELDPRLILRAIAESEYVKQRTRLRAAKLLRHIDSPHCVCFPGDIEAATRTEIVRWLQSNHSWISTSAEAAVLDVKIMPSVLRAVRTGTGRTAYPALARMLQRFEELAHSSREWLPFDLYTALDPPQPDRRPSFREINLKS